MTTLLAGSSYKTRDGRTTGPLTKTITGTFHDAETRRYFTPQGGCIAYYRGDDPIIEDTKSIDVPQDPEADIADEIHADEEKARDPHGWQKVGGEISGAITVEYEWCHDCGSLRTTTTIMRGAAGVSEIKITTPREYHTCGTNKSKKPART